MRGSHFDDPSQRGQMCWRSTAKSSAKGRPTPAAPSMLSDAGETSLQHGLVALPDRVHRTLRSSVVGWGFHSQFQVTPNHLACPDDRHDQ
eukprot:3937892-Rhodomonas_salina.1